MEASFTHLGWDFSHAVWQVFPEPALTAFSLTASIHSGCWFTGVWTHFTLIVTRIKHREHESHVLSQSFSFLADVKMCPSWIKHKKPMSLWTFMSPRQPQAVGQWKWMGWYYCQLVLGCTARLVPAAGDLGETELQLLVVVALVMSLTHSSIGFSSFSVSL